MYSDVWLIFRPTSAFFVNIYKKKWSTEQVTLINIKSFSFPFEYALIKLICIFAKKFDKSNWFQIKKKKTGLIKEIYLAIVQESCLNILKFSLVIWLIFKSKFLYEQKSSSTLYTLYFNSKYKHNIDNNIQMFIIKK